jgi:DNA-binding XRE family transcriptional regulator
MISSQQMKAARALAQMDQADLAYAAGLSLPTIQRMEASNGIVRGNVNSLVSVVEAFKKADIEIIGENANSYGTGRGVRLMN